MRHISLLRLTTWGQRAHYHLRWALWRLGLLGCLSAAAFVGLILFWVCILQPWHSVQDTPTLGITREDSSCTFQEDIEAYLDILPKEPRPAVLIGELYDKAGKLGLRLSNVEFQMDASSKGIPSVVIGIDTLTDADKVVALINVVLHDMPYSALSQISMKRLRSADTQLEAHLVFRFFWGTP